MTRGYFVEEQNNKIIKAVELPGSAYLGDGGYGEEILEAYQKGNEQQCLESLRAGMSSEQKKEISRILPEWYRVTKYTRLGDYVAEYGYVLKDGRLFVYQDGKPLFTADRTTVSRWLHVVRNLTLFENTYLYNEEKLDMEYEKTKAVFSQLAARIRKGCTEKELDEGLRPVCFIPTILRDEYCIDVWHRPDRPAYIKQLAVEGQNVEFIVSKEYGKWHIYLQLPYIRINILKESKSERAAVNEIRCLVRGHREELVQFAQVSRYVGEAVKEIREKELFNLERHRQQLQCMYNKQPWYCADHLFSIEKILRELRESWYRQQEQKETA